MTSNSIRLIKHSLVLPVVFAGTSLAILSAAPAMAQSSLILPNSVMPPQDPGAGNMAPRSAANGTPMGGPSYQAGPRSLLPAAEPPEFNSFNPDPATKRIQEASADPEAGTANVIAANPIAPSAGPVAIPVQESSEAAPASPAAVAAAVEVKPAPRQRGRTVIPVAMDQALVVRSPANVRTMILGNPMIADVAAQKGGLIVVTGKMYGSTNLVLVDAKGAVIGEAMIQVQPPKVDVVTVQLGLQRQSYSCTPLCQPTMVVGNEQSWFSSTSGQAQQRNSAMKSGQ